MSGPFKLKYNNSAFPFKSPMKQNGDTTSVKKAEVVKVLTEEEKFKKMTPEQKLEHYKKSKAKPISSGRKSIKSSDLTEEQMQNIFPQ